MESVKSTFKVTLPESPPPLKPVPAVTSVMFPASVEPILDDNEALKLVNEPLISVAICAELLTIFAGTFVNSE